jgi:hypothetical protein
MPRRALKAQLDLPGSEARVNRSDPKGVEAISRWLSTAIPPVRMAPEQNDPRGVAAARASAGPRGSRLIEEMRRMPGASLRPTPGSGLAYFRDAEAAPW